MITRRTLLGTAIGGGLVLGNAGGVFAADDAVATTRYGKVRGAKSDGINVFKGIPYGASTGGAARFRPPKPPVPWRGVRDTVAFAPMAPQVKRALPALFGSWTFDNDMSEDCLALNVWTPALKDGRKRPVMVWFHGGDFSSLSGSRNVYDGVRLCRKGDVVVVTLNHRLNLFGYMYLAGLVPELKDSGNVGLLDLILALHWVRDNIAEFGGDSGNVTIFGQSGGGGKVNCLMAMPAAKGLFHRAIVQSGAYYLQAMDAEAGSKETLKLLTALGLQPAAAEKLTTLPMEALVEGFAKSGANFRPVADSRALPAGPWYPAAPAISRDIPLMLGTTATEMTLLTGARDAATFTLDEAGLRQRLARWFAAGDIDRVLATFRTTWPNASPSDLYFAVDTDMVMRQGAWQEAERKAAQAGAPAYLYELDWRTPVDGGKWHSPHSLDLAFVFDNVAKSASMVGEGPEPQALADQMSSAWLAFARTGNPNNPALPHWPAYSKSRRATMVFDRHAKVVNDFRGAERKLLASLPEKPVG
jgi:para-nitrobenzyl esterase